MPARPSEDRKKVSSFGPRRDVIEAQVRPRRKLSYDREDLPSVRDIGNWHLVTVSPFL
jgi:hypothetical protein